MGGFRPPVKKSDFLDLREYFESMAVYDSTPALKTVNGIIFTLQIIGAIVLVILGFYSGYYYLIALGIASLLFGTLVFFVVTVFWEHVQRSATRNS